VIDVLLNVGRNLDVLATQRCAKLRLALYLLTKANTARAVDTTSHVRGDQRAEIFVLYDALAIVVARYITAVTNCKILQFTLTTLVTDRTIKGMVNEQEFHRRLLCGNGTWRLGKYFHAFGHRLRTGRNRLGSAFDVDETHTAAGRDTQLVVIAESRNVGADLVGYLDDHLTGT